MTTNAEEFSLMLPTGLRLGGKTWGPRKDPKERVLALHGWLDNASTWDGLGPLLAEKGIYMVCLDFLGHGKSDHEPSGQYSESPFSHVTTVYYAINVIGWKSFVLMGHSMGAAVASLVAAAVPNFIKSLVLVEGLGPWPRQRPVTETLQIGLQQRNKAWLERKPKVYPTVQAAIDKLRENNRSLAEHSAQVIVRRSLVKVEGGYSFSHDPRLVARGFYTLPEEDALFILESIRCPTLMFYTNTTLESYKEHKAVGLTACTPNANQTERNFYDIYTERMNHVNQQCSTKVLLDEGSHHVHLDLPELIAGHILAFLQSKAKL